MTISNFVLLVAKLLFIGKNNQRTSWEINLVFNDEIKALPLRHTICKGVDPSAQILII